MQCYSLITLDPPLLTWHEIKSHFYQLCYAILLCLVWFHHFRIMLTTYLLHIIKVRVDLFLTLGIYIPNFITIKWLHNKTYSLRPNFMVPFGDSNLIRGHNHCTFENMFFLFYPSIITLSYFFIIFNFKIQGYKRKFLNNYSFSFEVGQFFWDNKKCQLGL